MIPYFINEGDESDGGGVTHEKGIDSSNFFSLNKDIYVTLKSILTLQIYYKYLFHFNYFYSPLPWSPYLLFLYTPRKKKKHNSI